MNNYQPHPNTVASRVVEYLRSLPIGMDASTSQIVETLGVDSGAVLTSTECAVEAGLIAREKRDGRYMWRCGSRPPGITNGSAVSLHERFDMPRVLPTDDADLTASFAPPAPAQEAASKPARKAAPSALRVGVWSDGSLVIERAGRVETYTPEETLQLVKILDRMLMKQALGQD